MAPFVHELAGLTRLVPALTQAAAAAALQAALEAAHEAARQELDAERRRLAEAERSIEALKAAAGADKESTIAALQVLCSRFPSIW